MHQQVKTTLDELCQGSQYFGEVLAQPASLSGWPSRQFPRVPSAAVLVWAPVALPSCCSAALQGRLPLAKNWARPRAGLVTGQVSSQKLVEQGELIPPALNCFWGKASEVEGFEFIQALHNLTWSFFPFSRFKSCLHFFWGTLFIYLVAKQEKKMRLVY